MFLKMCIGKVLIAKQEIEFDGMQTLEEKIIHVQNRTDNMLRSAYVSIHNVTKPVFFIEPVPSKMNDYNYENIFERWEKQKIKNFYRKMDEEMKILNQENK